MTRQQPGWVHFFVPFFFFLIGKSPLTAQEQEVTAKAMPTIWLNLNFSLGIPQQQFRDRLDAIGYGAGGNLLLELPNLPLQTGLDIAYTGYQRAKLELELDVGGFFQDFDLITRNNIFQMHGLLRFEPPLNFFLRPFADGMIGTKLLYTRTRLINRDDSEEGVVETNTNQRDWAFSYGGTLGLKVYLLEAVTVELRCAYLMGDNATYLVKRPDADQLVIEDTIDAFEEKRSPTHLLTPQIGITLDLIRLEEE